MKVKDIHSASPTFPRAKANVIWINLEPEGETEKALVRSLAGHTGKILIYNDGTVAMEFRAVRRKGN